jgi:hypothetical protein
MHQLKPECDYPFTKVQYLYCQHKHLRLHDHECNEVQMSVLLLQLAANKFKTEFSCSAHCNATSVVEFLGRI